MIRRKIFQEVIESLSEQAVVALLGPRQIGKTTLALKIAETRPSLYLDLEDPQDRSKLTDPVGFLSAHDDKLVILDEIHRVPDLFQVLRGIIDKGRRDGRGTGRFLLLGSASMDLLRQSGETLAGRVSYIELTSVTVREYCETVEDLDRLWIRGGFPRSLLAESDRRSLRWRLDFIRTYLERDIPAFGPRIPAETLKRFWTMLAHDQGSILNASRLGAGLGVKGQTISRYTDLMVDLLLLRRLMPYHANVGKRLIKSPKLYIRDSGILHALLNIPDRDTLLGHSVSGMSWEGLVVETLIGAAGTMATPFFYRTMAGSEIDLVIERSDGLWAIEIKRGPAPRPDKGFYIACDDLKPERRFVVHPRQDRYPISENLEVIGLEELAGELDL
ncbi:MAG: ATP-binding protein [Pseudomonadota bacterium]|nr:ATP-binding protein [Pseudomonadota bacterium]